MGYEEDRGDDARGAGLFKRGVGCCLIVLYFAFTCFCFFLARIGGDALAVRRSNVMGWSYTLLELEVDCQNEIQLLYADLLVGCIL